MLERIVPDRYALVTASCKAIVAKVEVRHKSEVEGFAQLYALPTAQTTIELPEGDAVAADTDHD